MSLISMKAALRLLAVAVVLVSPAAMSADAPKKGNVLSLGQGKPVGKLLTRNELRACLAQEVRVRDLNKEAIALQQSLDGDKAEIGRRTDELRQSLEMLDRTSEEAVSSYKAKSAEHDQLIDAYNAKLPTFNAKADALNAEREAFAKDCADRPYDEGDFFAIKRGK